MRVLVTVLMFVALDAQAQQDGVALLPLRSRGLLPKEQQRIEQKVVSGWRSARADVVEPAELLGRIARDDRRRSALQEARRLRAEGIERYLGLDRAGARERFERALALYRDNFGEYVDAGGYAETHLWRGTERLASGDEPSARADFAAAASLAPQLAPTTETFPPPVIEAFQQAARQRTIPSDKPEELAALAGALGVGTIALARAERGGSVEEGVLLEVRAWTSANAPPRSARVVLPALLETDLEKASDAAASVARPTLSVRTVEIPRNDPVRQPPIRRPPRRADRRTPLIMAGVGILAVGAMAGYLEYDRRQDAGGPPDEFGVIIVPP